MRDKQNDCIQQMNSIYRKIDRYLALLYLVQRENVGCVKKNLLLFDAHVFA
jgi:hypothetical protein